MVFAHRRYRFGIATIGVILLVWIFIQRAPAQEMRFREFVESTQSPVEQATQHSAPLPRAMSELDSEFDLRLNPTESLRKGRLSLYERLWGDQKNFYSGESMMMLGSGLLVGGALANSNLDEGIDKHFQSSVRRASSDDWFHSLHASKELGNGMYTLPLFATAWSAGAIFPDSLYADTGSRWGERSMRSFVVGAPMVILLQRVTGGSRPGELVDGSKWHPFQDNNGISGHAFMGSLPFITAAKMTKNSGYKALLYAGSTIAPLSRVNDSAHYSSQVALGWWMAFLAASAVDATDDPDSKWNLLPYMTGDGSGLAFEYRF